MQLASGLTNSDVDLPRTDLSGNCVHGLETRATLPVEGANGDGLGNSGSESSHASGKGTPTGWEDVSNGNVLDESGVDTSLLPDGTQYTREVLLGPGVLETSFHALGDR